jgi:four helix bundle protein
VQKKIDSYRDLEIWKRGMIITERVYRLVEELPSSEKYGLRSQMTRASVSIPSNIAEGHSRQHVREFIQMLYVARGSLSELETQIELATRLGYFSADRTKECNEDLRSEGRMINGLIRALRAKVA